MSALRSAFSAARAATRRNVSTSAVVRSDTIMMVRVSLQHERTPTNQRRIAEAANTPTPMTWTAMALGCPGKE